MFRRVLVVASLLVSASAANAQITTYIAPPRAPTPSAQMVASADSARKDSVAQTAMTNMKAWVDSAAGVPIPEHVGAIDSTALANDPGRPITTFSNGAVAPATASSLPTIALVGIVSLALGAALLARRRRA
jgi:LPXTG-motif cell wall-anchored protein